MKMKPTILAAASACLLSIALSGQLYAAGQDFQDLGSISGKDKIISLKDRNLIQGVTETEFKPQAALSNAQGIQLIASGLNLSLSGIEFIKEPQASDNFSSVKNDAWFAKAFINAHFNGLDIPSDIDPATTMTKEEFTHYLIQGIEKAGKLPMINLVPRDILDEADITASYQGSIQRSLAWNVSSLDSNGKFNPKDEITRGEAAVMLYNALEYLQSHQEPKEIIQ